MTNCIKCGVKLVEDSCSKNRKYCAKCSPLAQRKGYHNFKVTCKFCSKETDGTHNQIYCSKECQITALSYIKFIDGLPTGTVGAIQELRVSTDLLAKGFEVFRALSPSCSCDLIARKDGKTYDIEVRTGYKRLGDKTIAYTKNRIRASYVAIATPDGLKYDPDFCS